MLSTHPELRKVIGPLFSLKMGILILTVIGCVLVYRFFCKTICPLGAIALHKETEGLADI